MKDLKHSDVFSKDTLQRWRLILEGNENSLIDQSIEAAHETLTYRLVIELSRMSQQFESFKVSPIFMTGIARVCARSGLSRIRAMLENSSPEDERGVYSLRWLINDLKKVRNSLTRKSYIDHCFDHFFLAKGMVLTEKYIADEMNSSFDRFCDSDQTDSCSSQDVLSNRVVDQLNVLIHPAESLIPVAMKYVSHSATAESQGQVIELASKTTYYNVYQAQVRLSRMVMFIAWFFFGIHYAPSGIYLGDLNKDLYGSLAGDEYADHIKEIWHTHFSSIFDFRRDVAFRDILPEALNNFMDTGGFNFQVQLVV